MKYHRVDSGVGRHKPSIRKRPKHRGHDSGAALLLAMLIVALVASLAASATWYQWRSAQMEADERAQAQSHWLVRGALDWSKIILYLDAQTSRSDHLNEPWSVPLAEAKLGTFLTAENNVAQDANADLGDAFFSGAMVDLHGRLNVTNLVLNGKVDSQAQQQFERLFEALGISPDLVAVIANRYLQSTQEDLSASVALAPSCVDQLFWLGLNAEQVELLRPHVTVLPARTKLNVNTASELVLATALPPELESGATRLIAVRAFQPFETLEEAQLLLNQETTLDSARFGVSSDFFEVSGFIRLDDLEVQERFIVQRDRGRLRTVRRECASPQMLNPLNPAVTTPLGMG